MMRATVFAISAIAAGGVVTDKHAQLRAHNPAPAPAPAGPAAPAGPIATHLDDPMPLKAAEQGFEGKDVQHKNQSTVVGDWRREYGPKGPQPLPPPAPPPSSSEKDHSDEHAKHDDKNSGKSGSVRTAVAPAIFITMAVLSVTV